MRILSKRLCIAASVFTLLVGLGVPLLVLVPKTSAAAVACQGPAIAFGRQKWCGYFSNGGFNSGKDVRVGGVPGSVNTAQTLIALIEGDLNSGNTQRRTAAQFIILNMIGNNGGVPRSVSAAQLQDWKDRVTSYASASQNGSQSVGPNGRIDWFVSQHTPCNIVNTYYQTAQNDVAPFLDTPGNSSCSVPGSQSNFIIFRDASGNVLYQIRRICMNPMGTLKPLEKPKPANYNLQPNITTTVGGNPANTVEVGDTIRFSYAINNIDNDPSPMATCTFYGNVHPGYFATPGSATASSSPPGYGPPPNSCPAVFPRGSTPIATQDVLVAVDDQTICRSLFVSPSSPTVASAGKEACVQVARKPYVKVFGGDVSVGNGLTSAAGSCSGSASSAIVSWNKRSPSYAGSGAQYAAYALGAITDFATASGNSSGATSPTGLAFSNTATNSSGGLFGGNAGTLPCIPDYYGARPNATMALPANAGLLATGVYASNSSRTLVGGIINPGTRASVYIKGDVYITSNLTYGGNWTPDTAPLFRLIVLGNIYIDRSVTQLDGLYVAQIDGGIGGSIYTCATASAPLVPDANFSSICDDQLTVNGAFVANRVLLLRTHGSLRQSTSSETNASATMAEKFNYSPALWMAQPAEGQPGVLHYDSITALPPIL
jgi:hypothetical protein